MILNFTTKEANKTTMDTTRVRRKSLCTTPTYDYDHHVYISPDITTQNRTHSISTTINTDISNLSNTTSTTLHASSSAPTTTSAQNYYGYRYYSSELGRWINRDPIGDRASLVWGNVGDIYPDLNVANLEINISHQISRGENIISLISSTLLRGNNSSLLEDLIITRSYVQQLKDLLLIYRNRIVEDMRWIGKSEPSYIFVYNNPELFQDSIGLSSVTKYHCNCMRLPTQKLRCACHCVYAADSTACEQVCTKCWGGKKKPSPYKLCMCTCTASGAKKWQCESLCKSLKVPKKKWPKWPKWHK